MLLEPTTRWKRRGRLLAALALLLIAVTGLASASPAAWAASAQELATEIEPTRFSSPREVMRRFEEIFDWRRSGSGDGLSRAAEVFDMSAVPPAERRERALELAQTLSKVFDRVAAVDHTEFPDAAGVGGGERYEFIAVRRDDEDARVTISFRRRPPDGWRIDAETVAAIPGMWRAVKDLPELEGFEKPLSPAEALRKLVPPRLKGGGILLETYQWIGLVALVLLGVILDRVLRLFLHPLIGRLGRGQGETIDRALMADFDRPVAALVITGVLMLGLPVLDIEPWTQRVLDVAASFVIAVAGVWTVYRMVDVLCWFLAQRAKRSANRLDDMMVPLLRRTLKIVVVVVGLVFIASRIAGDLWGVFAGLSIGSLAVGFAAKDSIENLFGTFTVMLDKPFQLGDGISVGGIEGSVEEVGFRSTRVRTWDGTRITVPNSRFISSDVENLSVRPNRRTRTVLQLTYDTPPEKIDAFCEGIRELIRANPYTKKDAFHVWFTGFAESSLNVLLQFHMETTDYSTSAREVHRLFGDVLRLARRLNVDFAFPTRSLYVVEPADGEPSDAPADMPEGIDLGRRLGRELADESFRGFEGEPPPPVRVDPADPDALGLRPRKE
jgi:MscS family membrane protein